MRRPRCRRPHTGRVVRPTRAAWCDATLAKRIRWREELVLVLRASKLAVAWIVCLDALPALGSHAAAINSLRDLVFGLGLLNTLAAVGLELADATTWRFPVMHATACEEKADHDCCEGPCHSISPKRERSREGWGSTKQHQCSRQSAQR